MMRPPEEPDYRPPPRSALRIIHQDDDVVVADKPSGLLSVPGRGAARQICALSHLRQMFGPVLDVHRLDMDTSGLIVFARTPAAQSHLSRQFEDRSVTKVYHALVDGRPSGQAGEIELPIGRRWDDRPKRCIDRLGGKPALTRWQILETYETFTRLELRPVTGRTHQLRLHLSAIGHPVLGDRLYGDTTRAARLCLHASWLELTHPSTGARLHFDAPAGF
ncbi:RluA family pseudouridine synthase [Henriciella marina]|uniref:RluA family pseudouridine synthase n=1 Tax=Henriciella marina TaxID=453851 RepID=UPI00037EC824|nr:RluA family pseudouridine synthase [Henriciella marina]